MDPQFELRVNEALIELNGPSNPSIRAVEKKYGVSKSTLLRRLDGGVSRRIARNAQQLLTIEQEQSLITWILTLESEGHAPTHGTVREMASQIARISGGPQTLGKRWIQRFFARNSELHSKLGKKIDHQRIDNANPDVLHPWFTQFRRVLTEYNVSTEDVWNMDESGIALGVCIHQKVIGTSLSTSVRKKTPENREWVTIIELVSAAGAHTRCLVIFKGKNVQISWFRHDTTPDWLYTCSSNG